MNLLIQGAHEQKKNGLRFASVYFRPIQKRRLILSFCNNI